MPVADDDPIAQLVAGTYVDPETGERLAAASRVVAIDDSLAGREAALVAELGLGSRLAVIADDHTHAALGDRVASALGRRFAVTSVVLSGGVHADGAALATLRARVDPRADAIVAVGAGTINDLAKLVAQDLGVPQAVFATAPSMNGYTSVSASITVDGVKTSIRAATPVGVFFDLAVLAAAPVRLRRAGLGDSLARPTAQADWLLAHLVLGRPYREVPFTLLAGDEPALLACAGDLGLGAGDLGAVRHLVRTLVLSGFGMTICGGSFPASQGEHLLAHYVEMMAPAGLPHAFHGEQIGVCALAMARLQDRILASAAPPRLAPSTITPSELAARFGEARAAALAPALAPKLLDADLAARVNATLARDWPAIRARLAAVTPGAARLEAALVAAGAPTTPTELGWPDALFADALAHAREIRDRYTFLDLDADLERSSLAG